MPSLKADDPMVEGARIMTICNACRYCEGYCVVFPAMERRLEFSPGDLLYLANLCHNCGACLPACQYAPPHEFAVNVPQTLAEIRALSYRDFAWPRALAGVFRSNALFVALALVVSVAAFLVASQFYGVISHDAMVVVFSLAGLYVLAVLCAGLLRFWQAAGAGRFPRGDTLARAIGNALSLENLGGGSEGCTYPDQEHPSRVRRVFHHLTFYGFLLCFAATVVAAVFDNFFGWKAPYPLLSIPVVFGTVGGIALVAGAAGLLWLIGRRDPDLIDSKQTGMDVAFIVMLLLVGVTGLLLLGFRESAAMGTLLAVHLGVVLGLFVTMPYGKFVHGVYRLAALVRSKSE